MGDALAGLLADITEPAHTIGTLQAAENGRPPRTMVALKE